VVRRLLGAALLAVVSCVSASARALDTTDGLRRALGAEVTFGQIDEDLFVTLNPKFYLEVPGLWQPGCGADWCRATLRLGAHMPLRVRFSDRQPGEGERLRLEDWDEPGDYLRVLRFVAYGAPEQALSARLGELGPLTFGGGAIVFQHFNTLTPDNHRPGARATLNHARVGADVFVDDVTGPSLIGGDVVIRPLGFLVNDAKETPLGVGVSAVVDCDAPTRLVLGPEGEAQVDVYRYPQVAASQVTTWISGRLFYDSLINFDDMGRIGVLVTGALHAGVGQGAHLGVSYRREGLVWAEVDAEWMVGSAGYLPRAIGPAYGVERYQQAGLGLGLPAPKLRALATLRAGAGGVGQGVFARAAMRAGWAGIEVAYQNMLDMPQADMATARLFVQPTTPVIFSIYAATGGAATRGLFRAHNTLVASELRVDVVPGLYLVVRWGQSFRLGADGVYAPVPDWHVGLGGAW
jgi:hypothetical protein